jgi:transposase
VPGAAEDAEAICEAMTRPTTRFVAGKSMEQRGVLMLHKTRDLLERQPTMLINTLSGHLAEFGIIAAQGTAGVKAAIEAYHAAFLASIRTPYDGGLIASI